MDVETFRLIYRITLIAAGVTSVIVPVTYWWVSDGKWRESTLGRHLMSSDTIIAVIFAFYIVANLIDYPKVELTIGIILFGVFGHLRIARARFMLRAMKTRHDAQKYAVTEEPSDEPTV